MRYKVAIRFGIEGDLRFISHRDMMRLFERALSRAHVPVKFSEGFNPRPKLSLPLPRAVGVASDAELLVVDLGEPMDPQNVLQQLLPQMPPGLHLDEAWAIPPGTTVQPGDVAYELLLPADQAAHVAQAVERLLASASCPVDRLGHDGKPDKTFDLRTYLVEASVQGTTLRWTVRVANEGSARPGEMLTVAGLPEQTWRHRVRRTRVNWGTPNEWATAAGGTLESPAT